MIAYEPGQDRNVAALSICNHVRRFICMTDQEYMRLALLEAQKAFDENEVPIGAVLVKNDIMIASCHNIRELTKLTSGHAEMQVIEKANKIVNDWQLVDCTIYVTLEPCVMCAGAIIQSRISKVVYGAKDPTGGAFGGVMNILDLPNINHRPTVVSGILEDECSEILKRFFKNKRKNK